MELGEVIQRVMGSRKITQQNLADTIGVSITSVNRWLNGGTITNDMIEKIAGALNVKVSELYEYKQHPHLLEEPLEVYKTEQSKSIDVIVRLDGTVDTLNRYLTTLKNLNSAL